MADNKICLYANTPADMDLLECECSPGEALCI